MVDAIAQDLGYDIPGWAPNANKVVVPVVTAAEHAYAYAESVNNGLADPAADLRSWVSRGVRQDFLDPLENGHPFQAGERLGEVGLDAALTAASGYGLLAKGADILRTEQVTEATRAASKVIWVDENAGMSDAARAYNDSAIGARSNPLTRRGQAPALERTLDDGSTRLVKFDGIDGDVMIDRKTSIVTTQKAMDQALRQSEALDQNGLTARWEVPNQTQATRAITMLNNLGISNITVEVVPWPVK